MIDLGQYDAMRSSPTPAADQHGVFDRFREKSRAMKFTPGPWHTSDSHSFYVFAHASLAEQAGSEHGPFVCNASTQANARLIACAPDLLHALNLMLREHDALQIADGKHDDRWPAATLARSIIAKAKGEA